MKSFTDYNEAFEHARTTATAWSVDMALRKSFNPLSQRTVYCVAAASKNDADYAKAEIICPGTPAGVLASNLMEDQNDR